LASRIFFPLKVSAQAHLPYDISTDFFFEKKKSAKAADAHLHDREALVDVLELRELPRHFADLGHARISLVVALARV
jgi:hypothetical protein